ncbi:hypothetical protein [Haliscomenobacter sp.]|uniref:hypothetical protein n=1 Tax=Haliscomenobacter sp. TaxID=2717303 RepID=UPI003364E915
MKTISATIVVALCFIFACHQDDPKPAIAGTYTGKSDRHSKRLSEIFISPTQSKMEWVKDSAFQQPAVLEVEAFSKDSFKLVGDFVKSLPPGWSRYGFSEATGTDKLVFKRNFGLSGYFFQEITLAFDPTGRILKIDYHSSSTTPQSDVLSHFEGKK